MPPPFSVNKLDAAKRQLHVAIKWWFANDDPVAVHTLAAASHEIIHMLFRRRGLRGLLFDSPFIRDEYRADFARALKGRASFFKHAQKDPDGEIEFDPIVNEPLLLASIYALSQMREPLTAPEQAFMAWFRLHSPHLFERDVFGDNLPFEIVEGMRLIERHEFLEVYERALALI